MTEALQEAIKSNIAHTEAHIYKCKRIKRIIGEEFASTVEFVQRILEDYHAEERLLLLHLSNARNPGLKPSARNWNTKKKLLIKRITFKVAELEALLDSYSTAGRLLRCLTSNRLRKEVESMCSLLLHQAQLFLHESEEASRRKRIMDELLVTSKKKQIDREVAQRPAEALTVRKGPRTEKAQLLRRNASAKRVKASLRTPPRRTGAKPAQSHLHHSVSQHRKHPEAAGANAGPNQQGDLRSPRPPAEASGERAGAGEEQAEKLVPEGSLCRHHPHQLKKGEERSNRENVVDDDHDGGRSCDNEEVEKDDEVDDDDDEQFEVLDGYDDGENEDDEEQGDDDDDDEVQQPALRETRVQKARLRQDALLRDDREAQSWWQQSFGHDNVRTPLLGCHHLKVIRILDLRSICL